MTTGEILTEYLDDLTTELELRGAGADAIEDIVRQVESHLWDTDVDPRQEFGSPADCARSFLPGRSTARFWFLIVASVALTVGGATLAIRGFFGTVDGSAVLGLIPPWWAVGAGVLLIGIWVVMLVRESHRR